VVQLLLPTFLQQLVYEKEKRLRIMMKMHGLGDGAYWCVRACPLVAAFALVMLPSRLWERDCVQAPAAPHDYLETRLDWCAKPQLCLLFLHTQGGDVLVVPYALHHLHHCLHHFWSVDSIECLQEDGSR
jgi:hypothetical protein